MAIETSTRLKAALLKAVIDQVTGGNAVLEDRESSIKIILTQDQRDWITKFLEAQLDMKRKPDIEIDALGIIIPVVFKKVLPYLLAAGGGLTALLLGKFGGKK
jgi:hypothetical protein